MKRDNREHYKHDEMGEEEENIQLEQEKSVISEEDKGKVDLLLKNEIEDLMVQLDEKQKKCDEYLNMLQRSAAEFDNYKKRTAKEKESFYSEISCEIVSAFLPVVDNFKRALDAADKGDDEKGLKEGIELVFKQLEEVLKNLGVEEINCVDAKFDPQLHNAVMHIEDEGQDENVVVEEFQKGYILKEKVIRHSMVKVCN